MVDFPIRAGRGNDDTELWDNASRLIEENRRLRGGLSGVPPWPPRFFCLGGTRSASVYAIDLTDPDAAVWWADHLHLDAPGSGQAVRATRRYDKHVALRRTPHGVWPATYLPHDNYSFAGPYRSGST
jgi:hypothetical protein